MQICTSPCRAQCLRCCSPARLIQSHRHHSAPEAARGFTHALHLQIADQGHGQLLRSCMDKVMADFLQAAGSGKEQQVDHSCADKLRPAPFFLSLNGPAP